MPMELTLSPILGIKLAQSPFFVAFLAQFEYFIYIREKPSLSSLDPKIS